MWLGGGTVLFDRSLSVLLISTSTAKNYHMIYCFNYLVGIFWFCKHGLFFAMFSNKNSFYIYTWCNTLLCSRWKFPNQFFQFPFPVGLALVLEFPNSADHIQDPSSSVAGKLLLLHWFAFSMPGWRKPLVQDKQHLDKKGFTMSGLHQPSATREHKHNSRDTCVMCNLCLWPLGSTFLY